MRASNLGENYIGLRYGSHMQLLQNVVDRCFLAAITVIFRRTCLLHNFQNTQNNG